MGKIEPPTTEQESIPQPNAQGWIYASLTVLDGPRKLKPAAAAFDRIRFDQSPRLTSSQVEIILVNGDEEQRHFATVLPHEVDAMRIPIRLVTE